MELFEKRVIIDIKMFHEIANGHDLSIALSLRNLGTTLAFKFPLRWWMMRNPIKGMFPFCTHFIIRNRTIGLNCVLITIIICFLF